MTREFTKILKTIPENRKAVAKNLIEEITFIKDTLKTLKNTISEQGTESHFENGKQSFDRESPAMNSYVKLVGRYGSLYRQLCKLSDTQKTEPEKSEILEFMNS